MDTTYEGWKNRSTWNVMLWINNDYDLYTSAVAYMKRKGHLLNSPYSRFIRFMGLQNERTADRIKWISGVLDYKELNQAMHELIED